MMPAIARDTISDVPPYETKGSGFPVMGNAPMTLAMLRNAWNTIVTASAPESVAANGASARLDTLMPAQRKARYSRMTPAVPRSPHSSPIIANTKSVSASGSDPSFSPEPPIPTPETPPDAIA